MRVLRSSNPLARIREISAAAVAPAFKALHTPLRWLLCEHRANRGRRDEAMLEEVLRELDELRASSE